MAPTPWRARLPPLLPTAARTLQILAAAHLFNSYIAELRSCYGFSMLPTLSHAGDFVLVSPIPYYRLPWRSQSSSGPGSSSPPHRPQRGDLVFATSPTDPRNTVCKRVIGIEGDVVEVEPRRAARTAVWGEGQESGYGADTDSDALGSAGSGNGEVHTRDAITRNDDAELGDAPLMRPRKGEGKFVKVPKGHVWLAGDNMSNSTDSRMYGPVPIGIIKGKVLARVYPNPRWFGPEIREIREITPPTSA